MSLEELRSGVLDKVLDCLDRVQEGLGLIRP